MWSCLLTEQLVDLLSPCICWRFFVFSGFLVCFFLFFPPGFSLLSVPYCSPSRSAFLSKFGLCHRGSRAELYPSRGWEVSQLPRPSIGTSCPSWGSPRPRALAQGVRFAAASAQPKAQ